MKYLKQNAGCIYPSVLDGHKSHTPKAAVHYAVHSLSRGNLKNVMPRSFTFVCPLYCCSSKHNNNNIRPTFSSCKTVSTSSIALATVNIDKIIKVTSASSYVFSSQNKNRDSISIDDLCKMDIWPDGPKSRPKPLTNYKKISYSIVLQSADETRSPSQITVSIKHYNVICWY